MVVTIGTRASSTSSNCGITARSDELVQSTATSGFVALIVLPMIDGDLDAQLAVEADHLAGIAADLAGIDIDGADDLEAAPRAHLLGDRRADRARGRRASL